jgi:hypothetical protein
MREQGPGSIGVSGRSHGAHGSACFVCHKVLQDARPYLVLLRFDEDLAVNQRRRTGDAWSSPRCLWAFEHPCRILLFAADTTA